MSIERRIEEARVLKVDIVHMEFVSTSQLRGCSR